MSVNIFYFEVNKSSENYSGYKDVNTYVFPNIFEANSVNILYKGHCIAATEFGFGIPSRMYNSDFELQSHLLQFISNRLSNPCIQPILLISIDDNSVEIDAEKYEITNINISELLNIFKKKVFNGLFLVNK